MNKTRIVLFLSMIIATALVCSACATPSKLADNWAHHTMHKTGPDTKSDASKNLQP